MSGSQLFLVILVPGMVLCTFGFIGWDIFRTTKKNNEASKVSMHRAMSDLDERSQGYIKLCMSMLLLRCKIKNHDEALLQLIDAYKYGMMIGSYRGTTLTGTSGDIKKSYEVGYKCGSEDTRKLIEEQRSDISENQDLKDAYEEGYTIGYDKGFDAGEAHYVKNG